MELHYFAEKQSVLSGSPFSQESWLIGAARGRATLFNPPNHRRRGKTPGLRFHERWGSFLLRPLISSPDRNTFAKTAAGTFGHWPSPP